MAKIKYSFIIAVAPWRNPEIIKCIEKQRYSKDKFEIIVKKGGNASKNRNLGIKRARGEIIVFLDDDASINENYLKILDDFLKKNPKVDIVGGPQLSPKNQNFFEKISGIVLTSNFGAYKVNKRYKRTREEKNADEMYLTSANMVVRKNVFNKIGYFNTDLWPGEDPEFIIRAKKSKLQVSYSPEIIIYHKRRGDLPSYIDQIFRYGITRPKLNRISKTGKSFFLIPLVFSIYFLLLPFLSLMNKFFIIPIVLYILIATLFSIYDSIKGGVFHVFFILPFIYLFTHLSYGLGMLIGYLTR